MIRSACGLILGVSLMCLPGQASSGDVQPNVTLRVNGSQDQVHARTGQLLQVEVNLNDVAKSFSDMPMILVASAPIDVIVLVPLSSKTFNLQIPEGHSPPVFELAVLTPIGRSNSVLVDVQQLRTPVDSMR